MRHGHVLIILQLLGTTVAQYKNYTITRTGDQEALVYDTASTRSNATFEPNPDVFLNTSVHIGDMDLHVEELTAKISLDAKILSMFAFGAGVRAHTDEVKMKVKDISSFAHLEARLGNLASMVNDALNSIDMNPPAGTIDKTSNKPRPKAFPSKAPIDKRSQSVLEKTGLANNLLCAIKDYKGEIRTNRILTQNGGIVDETLDLDGNVISQKQIGNFETDMTLMDHEEMIAFDENGYRQSRYLYNPLPGIKKIVAISKDKHGTIKKAHVVR